MQAHWNVLHWSSHQRCVEASSVSIMEQLWNLWVVSITRIFLRKMRISGNSRSWFSMLTPTVLRLSLSWISCVCVFVGCFVGACNNSTVDFSTIEAMVIHSYWAGFTLDPCGLTDTMFMVFVTEKNWRKYTSLFWEVRFQYLKIVRVIGISKKILFQVENFDFYKEGFSIGRAEQLNLL